MEIDSLFLGDLIDNDKSTKIKNELKSSISKLYENIKNHKLNELDANEIRAIAGVVLTKTVLIKLFASCPDCLNLKIDPIIKATISSRIEPLLIKPYKDFTQFESEITKAKGE
jgi:hypothetical protein